MGGKKRSEGGTISTDFDRAHRNCSGLRLLTAPQTAAGLSHPSQIGIRTIIINEAPRKRGRFDPRYEARLLGESDLLALSETPVLDAARALLARGDDPQIEIVVRRGSSVVECWRSTIGEAAAITVREDWRRGPELVAYEPFSSAGIVAPVELRVRSAQMVPAKNGALPAPLSAKAP